MDPHAPAVGNGNDYCSNLSDLISRFHGWVPAPLQEEAFDIADKVVVFNHGRVEQHGEPEELVRSPASPFVMQFVSDVNTLPSSSLVRGADSCLRQMPSYHHAHKTISEDCLLSYQQLGLYYSVAISDSCRSCGDLHDINVQHADTAACENCTSQCMRLPL